MERRITTGSGKALCFGGRLMVFRTPGMKVMEI